jgi:hypothetical protein
MSHQPTSTTPRPPEPNSKPCTAGVCLVAGEAALQHVAASHLNRLRKLLAAGRYATGGVPADWSLAVRRGDLGRLEAVRPEVAYSLRAPQHSDTT